MPTRLAVLAGTSAVLLAATAALAQQLAVDIKRVSDSGEGEKIGSVVVADGTSGLTFKVAVTGLPKGPHGFHVHEKGSCAPAMKDGKMTAGIAAGDHYDPEGHKAHKGPKGGGHKGDLPQLTATDRGIEQTVTAPQLKLADVIGRSLVIHEGGDNYTDNPENGGGRGRIACGIVPGR